MEITAQLVKQLREMTGAGMMDCKKALQENNGDIEQAIKWLREKGISNAAKKGDRVAAEGLAKIITKNNKAVIYEVNSETDFVAKNTQFLELLETIGNGLIDLDTNDVNLALETTINGKTINELIVQTIATIGEKITLRRFEIVTKNSDQNFGIYQHVNGRIAVLLLFNGFSTENGESVAMHTAAVKPKFMDQSEISQSFIENEKSILMQTALNEGKPQQIVEKMVSGRLNKQLMEMCLVDQEFVINHDFKVGDFIKANNGEIKKMIRYEVGEGIEKQLTDFASEVMAQAKL